MQELRARVGLQEDVSCDLSDRQREERFARRVKALKLADAESYLSEEDAQIQAHLLLGAIRHALDEMDDLKGPLLNLNEDDSCFDLLLMCGVYADPDSYLSARAFRIIRSLLSRTDVLSSSFREQDMSFADDVTAETVTAFRLFGQSRIQSFLANAPDETVAFDSGREKDMGQPGPRLIERIKVKLEDWAQDMNFADDLTAQTVAALPLFGACPIRSIAVDARHDTAVFYFEDEANMDPMDEYRIERNCVRDITPLELYASFVLDDPPISTTFLQHVTRCISDWNWVLKGIWPEDRIPSLDVQKMVFEMSMVVVGFFVSTDEIRTRLARRRTVESSILITELGKRLPKYLAPVGARDKGEIHEVNNTDFYAGRAPINGAIFELLAFPAKYPIRPFVIMRDDRDGPTPLWIDADSVVNDLHATRRLAEHFGGG
jgi:hypothetical protein